MGFMTKLVELWLTLIARLKVVIRMEQALATMVMLDMVQLMVDMGKATMNLNTNVTRAMKLNATPLLERYHLIIARIEKKVCEKLTKMVPVPVESQNCHDENKKVCELEERSQPKQVKKYVYTKECRPVPKTVCDNADQKFLKLSCVPSSRKECSYHPEESCEDIPKEHCYQIPYQVKEM